MSWWNEKQYGKKFNLMVGGEERTKEWLLVNMDLYFKEKLSKTIPSDWLNQFSVIPKKDKDREYYQATFNDWKNGQTSIIKQLLLTQDQLKAVGCVVGLSIGDALGASTEFEDYNKTRQYWIKNDFRDLKKCVEQRILSARSGEIGIWTDDCSMALSMGTAILLNNYKFDPITIRYMFYLWLEHGLDNGGRSHSIGLGGNISMSMREFGSIQKEFTKQGDQNTSGNGSLMRLGPCPIAYRHNEEEAVTNAGNQSKTTHQGIQAYQCSRLLALIIVRLVNRKEQQFDKWREVIQKACNDYCVNYGNQQGVVCLAESKCESQQMYEQKVNKIKGFSDANKSIDDRNWNWKDPKFGYSQYRAKRQPGYVGSYCMDALSMALHIVWHKNSFKEMVLWAINMGGDCDTVGAIVGQIAGSIFGFNKEMLHLYSQMVDFTQKRFESFLIGMKLATKRKAFESKHSIKNRNIENETQGNNISLAQNQVSVNPNN